MTGVLEIIIVPVQVEQVRLLERFSNKSTSGTLHLTATHLIFVESNNTATTAAQEIWVRSTSILIRNTEHTSSHTAL